MKILAIAFAAAFAFSTVPAIASTEVVDTYVKKSYKFTCIMKKDDLKYCGNWKVVK